MEIIESVEEKDAKTEINLDIVKARAVRGVVILTGRGFILNIISQIAQFFLLALLEPAQFGVFWIVSAVVGFLVYFSDVGLSAALIQKKEHPQDEDLKTTFFIQQALIWLLLIILYLISPILVKNYHLTGDGKMLLYALGFSLFLSSLKTIPSVLLERKLEFVKFVIPEIVEVLVYNLVLVFLAYKGFGIKSFTYAVLARGFAGVFVIYLLQPWKPAFALSKKALRGLLKFGLPYQVNTLLATVKDQGVTILLGGILGPAGVGYLGTAQRLSQIPLRLFMDNVTRVSFPAFSRMQEVKDQLARSVTRSILFITFLSFPALLGFLLLAPVLIHVFPKYAKWNPAMVPLIFMTINSFFAAVTTQLTNLLNAIGKIKITFRLMIMWTLLTITIVPFLSIKNGLNGAALGYSIVGLSSVIAIYLAKKEVNFSLTDSALKTLFSTLVMGISILALRLTIKPSVISLIVMIFSGVIIYGLSSYILLGKVLVVDVKRSIKTLFKSN